MTLTASTIEILPIRPEHIESFAACLDTVARERLYLSAIEGFPSQVAHQAVRASIQRGSIHLVAADAAQVVGWCEIARDPREGFRHCGRIGIGVHPGYRGRGIGRRLIEQALSEARLSGIERVEGHLFASNTRAIDLYRKLGFEQEGLRHRARYLDGAYDDMLVMALFLWPAELAVPEPSGSPSVS